MFQYAFLLSQNYIRTLFRGKFRGGREGRSTTPPPLSYFLQSLAFLNHFEEIQIVLFKSELIISNATLTYVYPNTLETYLTLNNLLFGTQFIIFPYYILLKMTCS